MKRYKLKDAVCMLLGEYYSGSLQCLAKEEVDSSVSSGLVKIYES